MALRNLAFLLVGASVAWGQALPVSLESIKPNKVKVEQVTYKGRQALRVTDGIQQQGEGHEDRLAMFVDTSFRDGTIEADIAGEPGPGASDTARGFVGVAFRVAPDLSRFECFYLRPTNGRADDQVRRNHSVQYISFPEFPWHRLRNEFPKKYETYADLAPGEWAAIRIEVDGGKARLFVNGVQQPTLLVNDLKHGTGTAGGVGLWVGPGTVAHVANVRISSRK